MAFDAILLASFGAPESPDEVIPFLQRVTAGRAIPPERLAEVASHYLALGGVSPLNRANRNLIDALGVELGRLGCDIPIYFGNRNAAPFFHDALQAIHAHGHRGVLAVATSAFPSYSGCRQYREDLAAALARTGLAGELDVAKLTPFADRTPIASVNAAALDAALGQLAASGIGPETTVVFFTTHSLPVEMATASGASGDRNGQGGAYVAAQLRAAGHTIELVAGGVRGSDGGFESLTWELAFQSRTGSPRVRWLEPDINDALRRAARAGVKGAVIVPLGFISDHVEVIWDLDTAARQTADELGLTLIRVSTVGTSAGFIAGLAADIAAVLAGPVEIDNGESDLGFCGNSVGLCSTDCCANPRGPQPAVYGVSP